MDKNCYSSETHLQPHFLHVDMLMGRYLSLQFEVAR